MFHNYILLAWRILARRKFFTFISLFGISFTLMILMLIAAYADTQFTTEKPMSNRNSLLIMPTLRLQYMTRDTALTIDSTLRNGVMVYDTTRKVGELSAQSTSNSDISRPFMEKYLTNLSSAKQHAFFSSLTTYDVYPDNGKITVSACHLDENYWKIFDFEVLEGRTHNAQDVAQRAQHIVITDFLAKKYFGTSQNVIGKEIPMDGKQFKVIGVVKKPRIPFRVITSMAFIPYTVLESDPAEDGYFGSYQAAFLAKSPEQQMQLQEEINNKAKYIPLTKEGFNHMILRTFSPTQEIAHGFSWDDDPVTETRKFFTMLSFCLFMFILLPMLNLINLNISRIMERSSEIGVRKAFGATSTEILGQFIFENVVLTFLGGAIGLVLAFIAIHLINDAQLMGEYTTLAINWKVFIYSVLITLFFGMLSGLLPAYRMSKSQIITALKQNQL